MLLLSRRSWRWRSEPATDAEALWTPLLPGHTWLVPGADQRLWLQTRRPLPGGWYLFGIRHRGDNRRATGWLLVGGGQLWRQGRPMYPLRRRWRVVRLARPARLTLELQRLQQPLQVQELWLLRLPAWDAWRRIRRRLKQPLGALAPHSRALLWRAYNRLLTGQARRHSLVPYGRWQRLVEQPAIAALPALSAEQQALYAVRHWGEPLRPLADGQWLVLLQQGSQLAPWALAAMAEACRLEPQAQLLYGDEDQLTSDGERHSPRFKPAWNRELCWCDPHFSNCWLVSGRLWNHWLQTSTAAERSSWQGAVLALVDRLSNAAAQIRHIPLVLSHQSGQPTPPLAPEQLATHLSASGAEVHPASHGSGYRLQWPLPASTLLSVVIPTRDRPELLEACLAAIDQHPAGCALEIVIADNSSVQSDTLAWLDAFEAASNPQRRQLVVRVPGPFNYAAINNQAAQHCQGSVLLLLNNDVELLSDGWGRELAANALRPDVGCVGALLLYPDRSVQHGGVILGVGGVAGHAHQDFDADAAGTSGRLQLAQELSAVTAACLAISQQHWHQLGGFDGEHLAVNYNDVDLCLRAQSQGLRNLYLPQVRAIHHESKSRGRPEGAAYRQWQREQAVMRRRWGALLQHDPAYSPHLSLEAADWSLALRAGAPLVR